MCKPRVFFYLNWIILRHSPWNFIFHDSNASQKYLWMMKNVKFPHLPPIIHGTWHYRALSWYFCGWKSMKRKTSSSRLCCALYGKSIRNYQKGNVVSNYRDSSDVSFPPVASDNPKSCWRFSLLSNVKQQSSHNFSFRYAKQLTNNHFAFTSATLKNTIMEHRV